MYPNNLMRGVIADLHSTMLKHETEHVELNYSCDFYEQDDFREVSLRNGENKLQFLINKDEYDNDLNATLILEDGLHNSVSFSLDFTQDENDLEMFKKISKVLINHFILAIWHEAMAEISAIGVESYVEKYHEKEIDWSNGYPEFV